MDDAHNEKFPPLSPAEATGSHFAFISSNGLASENAWRHKFIVFMSFHFIAPFASVIDWPQ